MSIKGWFGIAVYFVVGCSTLAIVGYGVSKLFSVNASTANAQTSASTNSPANTLPGPEDIAVDSGAADASAAMPAAPEEEVANAKASAQKPNRDLGILEGVIEQYEYQGIDKRDPFAPYISAVKPPGGVTPPVGPVTELERFELEQLRLVGIIWGVPKPKALFLDPNQKTYVVFNKTRIGRNSGYVAEIREGEVVVIEAFNNEGRYSYQPRIIKLQRE